MNTFSFDFFQRCILVTVWHTAICSLVSRINEKYFSTFGVGGSETQKREKTE